MFGYMNTRSSISVHAVEMDLAQPDPVSRLLGSQNVASFF